MIYGEYRDNAPRISALVQEERDEQEIEFVIDTAFDGDISLPRELIQRLGLPYRADSMRVLADGTVDRFAVYEATIEWLDGPRLVEVISLASRPLLGTALLFGSHMDIGAIVGGSVLVEPLE